MFFGALIVGGWGVVGWFRNSYLGSAEIASVSSRNCPWEIYKNLGLPLSTITFTVNSHADNHFYNYICFKCYTLLMKYKFRFFIFTFDLNVKHRFFSNKNHGLHERLFIEKDVHHPKWVYVIEDVMISIEMINKNQNILEK